MPGLPSGLFSSGFPTKTHIACWITMATHTITICNNYCFSSRTLVARIHLNITLHKHYLSFLIYTIACFTHKKTE
jgi:hypothetical protein